MLFFHPVNNQQQYLETDSKFRSACCEIGFDDRYYCSKYFQQRRINDCTLPRQYTPPAIGMWLRSIIIIPHTFTVYKSLAT